MTGIDMLKPPNQSAEDWQRAVDESWAWFAKHLGRTPHAIDVQHWLDGYIPKDAVIPPQKPALPDFVTIESRTGTSARAWCRKCDFGSNGYVSPREAFDWAYEHVKEHHWLRAEMERAKQRKAKAKAREKG